MFMNIYCRYVLFSLYVNMKLISQPGGVFFFFFQFKNQTPQKNFNPFYNNIHEQEKAELETKYQSVISKLKSMICVSTTSPSKVSLSRPPNPHTHILQMPSKI